MQLKGRGAFITGGASGIGLAIASNLARRGARVAIVDIDASAAEKAAAELRNSGADTIALQADVTDAASLERAVQEAIAAFGRLHLICCNAGAFTSSSVAESSAADWEWLISINLMGVVNTIHATLPHLLEHGDGGHIVNTASVAGHMSMPGIAIYSATKFAVVALSEALRGELKEQDVGVSVLCPGVVKTNLLETSGQHRPERFGGPTQLETMLDDTVPGGTDPDDVGRQVCDAIEAGRFYIFTHPELRPIIESRLREIIDAQN
jgi:NAD(P)-dependent dehydrogenase (short-subunit alcohol dehydrogenase family)